MVPLRGLPRVRGGPNVLTRRLFLNYSPNYNGKVVCHVCPQSTRGRLPCQIRGRQWVGMGDYIKRHEKQRVDVNDGNDGFIRVHPPATNNVQLQIMCRQPLNRSSPPEPEFKHLRCCTMGHKVIGGGMCATGFAHSSLLIDKQGTCCSHNKSRHFPLYNSKNEQKTRQVVVLGADLMRSKI